MAYSPVLGNPKPQVMDANGDPYVGLRYFFYAAGTSTKVDTQTDSTGSTNNTNPVVFDAEGYPDGNVMIYGANNTGYKVVAAPPGTDDPPTSPLWTIDNIYPGITVDGQWVNPYPAVYVSGTSFKVTAIDLTSLYEVGQRIYLEDTASASNDRYANILTAVYVTDTTFTLFNIEDNTGAASTLHADMDNVYQHIISAITTGAKAIAFQHSASNSIVTNQWLRGLQWVNAGTDFGFSVSETAANNTTYLQRAIDSNVGTIIMPSSGASDVFNINEITIDRALIFKGSGSSGGVGTGNPGASTTKLVYGGTGIAITLIGSGSEGKENIHLSDFSLYGNASATGGIKIGEAASSGVFISKSTFKNIHIRTFPNTGAEGLRLALCLESTFENIYVQDCYDGIKLQGSITSCQFNEVYSRTNVRYGWDIINALGCNFNLGLAESNNDIGLNINTVGSGNLNFYNWYSENNCSTSGAAPIVIGSDSASTVLSVNFFGGTIYDQVSNIAIALDYANNVSFYSTRLSTYNDFMSVTSNTIACNFFTSGHNITSSNVTGNHINGMIVHSGESLGKDATTALADSTPTILNMQGGLIVATDLTNNKTGLYILAGTAGTVVEVFSDSAHFTANASGTAGAVNFYYGSGLYRVNQKTGAPIDLLISSINTDGL